MPLSSTSDARAARGDNRSRRLLCARPPEVVFSRAAWQHAAVMRHVMVQGVSVPAFFYGTAWKEDRTEALTRLALDSGFAAIDTANQRRHYHEAGVGSAVAAFLAAGHRREELFLQTKFTSVGGQDHRLPYDARATLTQQVEQSFASSLEHLQVS